jgi:hypothetical protein
MDVPAPRQVTGTPSGRHASITAATSSACRGAATTAGTTR